MSGSQKCVVCGAECLWAHGPIQAICPRCDELAFPDGHAFERAIEREVLAALAAGIDRELARLQIPEHRDGLR